MIIPWLFGKNLRSTVEPARDVLKRRAMLKFQGVFYRKCGASVWEGPCDLRVDEKSGILSFADYPHTTMAMTMTTMVTITTIMATMVTMGGAGIIEAMQVGTTGISGR